MEKKNSVCQVVIAPEKIKNIHIIVKKKFTQRMIDKKYQRIFFPIHNF